MDTTSRIRTWVNEHVPMLAKLYENKYVGMLYDRFASLPGGQQQQILLGFVAASIVSVLGYLAFSYGTLWSESSRTEKAQEMANLLQQYKLDLAAKAPVLEALEKNSRLATPNQLKQFLMEQSRAASISPQLIQVEERETTKDPRLSADVVGKQAMVVLERVNLSQLKTFLTHLEYGDYNLKISLLRITNDTKTRGYLKCELQVMAYIFQTGEGNG